MKITYKVESGPCHHMTKRSNSESDIEKENGNKNYEVEDKKKYIGLDWTEIALTW